MEKQIIRHNHPFICNDNKPKTSALIFRNKKVIGDYYEVVVECAGVNEKDLAVSLQENILYIQGILLIDNQPTEEILNLEIPVEKLITSSPQIIFNQNLLKIIFPLRKEYCEIFFKKLGEPINKEER